MIKKRGFIVVSIFLMSLMFLTIISAGWWSNLFGMSGNVVADFHGISKGYSEGNLMILANKDTLSQGNEDEYFINCVGSPCYFVADKKIEFELIQTGAVLGSDYPTPESNSYYDYEGFIMYSENSLIEEGFNIVNGHSSNFILVRYNDTESKWYYDSGNGGCVNEFVPKDSYYLIAEVNHSGATTDTPSTASLLLDDSENEVVEDDVFVDEELTPPQPQPDLTQEVVLQNVTLDTSLLEGMFVYFAGDNEPINRTTFVDKSGYSNYGYCNLTSNNPCPYLTSDAKFGKAFKFSEARQQISLGKQFNGNLPSIKGNENLINAGTLSMWFKPSFGKDKKVYTFVDMRGPSCGPGFVLYKRSKNDRLAFATASGSDELTIRDVEVDWGVMDGWQHLVARWDMNNNSFDIILNGKKILNYTGGNMKKPKKLADALRIGILCNNKYSFEGLMDEVALWDRVLTDEEIEKLYNANSPLVEFGVDDFEEGGIQKGVVMMNATFVANQRNGVFDKHEYEVVCNGDKCMFNRISVNHWFESETIRAFDSLSYNGFIMYSKEDIFERFADDAELSAVKGLEGASHHFIAVRYSSNEGGVQWYYDDNSQATNPFTPEYTDILVAKIQHLGDTQDNSVITPLFLETGIVSCSDDDGKATGDGQYYIATAGDSCANENTLNEKICNLAGSELIEQYNCENGCFEGACNCSDDVQCPQGYICDSSLKRCLVAGVLGGICGDGMIDSFEQCDDGNLFDGDGCSSTCLIETNYNCVGAPSVCTLIYTGDLTLDNSCVPIRAGENRIPVRSRVKVEPVSEDLTGDFDKGVNTTFEYLNNFYTLILRDAGNGLVLADFEVSEGNYEINDIIPPLEGIVLPIKNVWPLFKVSDVELDDEGVVISASISFGNNTIFYCDPRTLSYYAAKNLDDDCTEDYQCLSNACLDGKCTSIRGELEEQRGLLVRILCYLKSIFSEEDYDSCIAQSSG